jgi:hypothetical protein
MPLQYEFHVGGRALSWSMDVFVVAEENHFLLLLMD